MLPYPEASEETRRTCQSITYISEAYLSNFLETGQSLHSLVQLNLCPRVEGKCIKVRDRIVRARDCTNPLSSIAASPSDPRLVDLAVP